ncbi:hypothetical protein F4813DRAFT_384247 [Daldinia decipiens]|uniref:uncharacterized protein n=1 Tax=Daldinia decipiens TaxID=326647 RepID=UPI0020C54521|nr:uncharacterized protein F4813DRAFT_384247 [Daldinia decipiens]KAI1662664.1 hypothetical protein F4813DRAFT_384247 [Daldinia decipiens]
MKFSVAALAFAAGASATYPGASESVAYPVSSASESAPVSSTSETPSYPVSSAVVSSSASVSVPASYPAVSSSASVSVPVPVSYPAGNATSATQYTTEVVTSYETYCPGPTQITYGTKTYTVTEPTTLTITDCPCTVSKPILTTSSVACATCAPGTTGPAPPTYPTSVPAPPSYPNNTVPVNTPTQAYPTGGVPGVSTPSTPIPTAGAGKVAALSGAGLAGFLGLAAALL